MTAMLRNRMSKVKGWLRTGAAVGVLLGVMVGTSYAASGTTEGVTVDADELETPYNDTGFGMSRDGRFAAFTSSNPYLVPGDTNGHEDAFVRDRLTGTTVRVSVDDAGNEFPYGAAAFGVISGDGRYVAFRTGGVGTFLHDRDTDADGTFDEPGAIANTPVDGWVDGETSSVSDISIDGRFVTFGAYGVGGHTLTFIDEHCGYDGDEYICYTEPRYQDALDVFVRDLQLKTTTLVSVDSTGTVMNANSGRATISDDGRYVGFVTSDDNGFTGFLHDRDTDADSTFDEPGARVTTQISVHYGAPVVSDDGRFVSFGSDVGQQAIYDVETKATTLISVDSAGNLGNIRDYYSQSAISDDGRYVAFDSEAFNLVPGDTNGSRDVFFHDRDTDADGTFDEQDAIATTRVSVNNSGEEANGPSQRPFISNDGKIIAFSSYAMNLVPNDTQYTWDFFVHDREGVASSDERVESAVEAGSTITTDTEGDGATATDPIETSITSPVAGTVSIQETTTTDPAPAGFTFLNQQVNIEAPVASTTSPLQLVFRIDALLIPPDQNEKTINIFRDGTQAEKCASTSPEITPDPCVIQRELLADGDVQISVLSSHASHWNVAVANHYSLRGFYQPVDMNGVVNTVRNGATVALKFEAFAGISELTDVAVVKSMTYKSISCDTLDATTEDTVETTTSGGTSLRYDAQSGQFVYNWQTPTQVGCYSTTVTTTDGSTLTALFKLK